MIKTFKRLLLLAAVPAVVLSSCSDESPWSGSNSEGGINLEFSADGRVMRQTRADDNMCPVIPQTEQFSVNLRNSDGSYSKDWSGIEGFNREASFPIGDYTLTASFGDLNVQGFEKPYFLGQAPVHVAPAEETTVQVVATLANSMVSVRYTDAFKENFTKYSASVQSEGHDWVVFSQGEDRPAFIAPGNEVKLNLTLTDTEGREVTIQPASFSAQARNHYIVTIGVDGSTGKLVLNVVFEEEVVNETVNVSLDDDLFTAEPPQVKAVRFDPNTVISGFEGIIEIPSAEFQVFTFGGLNKANLNFETDSNYTPSFGKNVQLVNADAALQGQLADAGVECIGFFNKPDKMGIVRVSEFLKKLPAGKHTIELQATDAMTRVSEPVKLTVNIQRVQFNFGTSNMVFFGATEINVDINTNCPDIKDKITFKAPDSNNRMTDVTVAHVEEIQPADALGHTYRFTLKVEPQYNSQVDVDATYNGTTIRTTLPVQIPEFEIETDAFAHHVLLRVTSKDNDVSQIVNSLRFANNGTDIPKGNISYEGNIIKIVGLNAGVTYSKMTALLGKVSKTIPEFTTENERILPNGDFSLTDPKINFVDINAGGVFEISLVLTSRSQPISSIIRSTPQNWADVNQLTCFPGSVNKNTWYMVPSSWVNEEGQTVIESVGYHHNGESLPNSRNGLMDYYCTSVPANLDRAAGELFLGSYPYQETSSSRSDGVEWSTRPSVLTFDYKYSPVDDSEKGVAYVTIIGDNGEVLSEQNVTLSARGDMTKASVSLSGYPFGKAARMIKLGFKSSDSGTPALKIPSGAELKEPEIGSGNYMSNNLKPRISANNYHAVARGSQLVVDNVVLGYDSNAASASKRKSSNKRR